MILYVEYAKYYNLLISSKWYLSVVAIKYRSNCGNKEWGAQYVFEPKFIVDYYCTLNFIILYSHYSPILESLIAELFLSKYSYTWFMWEGVCAQKFKELSLFSDSNIRVKAFFGCFKEFWCDIYPYIKDQ